MKLETPDGLKIKYTKPHGSIDWFKQIDYSGLPRKITLETISRNPTEIPDNFEERLSKQIFTETEKNALAREAMDTKWYPAITAPVGKYDFVCAEHITEIEKELKNTTSVLCIGFSALDTDILDLIRDNMPRINRLKIVNGSNNPTGIEAYDRIKKHCKNLNTHREDSVFNGGFSDLIQRGIQVWVN